MKKTPILLVLAIVLLNGCASVQPEILLTAEMVESPWQTPTSINSSTPEVPPTITSFPTPEKIKPTSTATTVFFVQGPGDIVCPILLYHRIEDLDTENPYVLGVEDFRKEMELLNERGYNTITVTQLVKAINFGEKLPERPVIISFDDGDISVFNNAFPIMKKLNFIGVGYLVGNYVGASGYMDAEQIQKLAKRGWEFGSHTQSHIDLSECKWCEYQVIQSKHNLEEMLGIRIETFAYPYGIITPKSLETVRNNYRGAMGLGVLTLQGPYNLFNLWRRPIDNGTTIEMFESYLPW